MAQRIVEIGDAKGRSFKIQLTGLNTTDLVDQTDVTWRVIDKGFIHYNSGPAFRETYWGKGRYIDVLRRVMLRSNVRGWRNIGDLNVSVLWLGSPLIPARPAGEFSTADDTYAHLLGLWGFQNPKWSFNDAGDGNIHPSWVLNFEPGLISWALV